MLSLSKESMEDRPIPGYTVSEINLPMDSLSPMVIFGANPTDPEELVIVLKDEKGLITGWAKVPLVTAYLSITDLMQSVSGLYAERDRATIQ